MHDIIIIGGGPAGLTAALYACRAGRSVLILEKNTLGGQITWSPKVENFPGFSSISGLELADLMTAQATNCGAELELNEVSNISEENGVFTLSTPYGDSYSCRAVIIATGAKAKKLGLEHEDALIGAGISTCAVCDGEFFRNKVVAVNGGGNTALQEAIYLSQICSKVYVIHRRSEFRADSAVVDSAADRDNIEYILNSTISAVHGDGKLSGVTLRTTVDGTEKELTLDGLFIAIGHEPENGFASQLIRLDQAGYADSGEDCKTIHPGIFVAGDCRKKEVRQLTTAVADGAVAALAACRYLDNAH